MCNILIFRILSATYKNRQITHHKNFDVMKNSGISEDLLSNGHN